MTVVASTDRGHPVPGRDARSTEDGSAVSERESRLAGIACLVFIAPLPLQWQVLAETPLGVVRYFQIGGAIMLLLYGFGVGRLHGLLGQRALLYTTLGLMTLTAVITAVNYGATWTEPIQNLVYAFVGLVFGAAFYTAMSHIGGRRILVWAAPLAVTWSLVELARNLVANGVDPITQLNQALVQADPDLIIFGIFRDGINGDGSTESASVRHEVVAALLVSILVTLSAAGVRRRWIKVLAGTACAVGGFVVIVSLSRAVLLAIVLAALAVIVRGFLKSSLSRPALVVSSVGLVGLVVAGLPLAQLVYLRTFDETGSYQSRLDAFDLARAELMNRVIAGGPQLQVSTHTLPFDVLLQAGWFAGLGAFLVVALFASDVVVAFRRYLAVRSRLNLIAVTAASLVLVRSMTSGGGFLHQVEWGALGIVIALTAASRTRSLSPPIPVAITQTSPTTTQEQYQ